MLDKRIAFITGANGAVGIGIIKKLIEKYSHGIVIVLGCRNIRKAQDTVDMIVDWHKNGDIRDNLDIIQIDLVDPKSCIAACAEFGKRYSRLDYLYLNAGILPVDGIDYKVGIFNLLTRPSYVAKTGGDILKQRIGETTRDGLGLVFCANVFGHFVMVRELEHLLAKSLDGRVIWTTSTTALPEFFDINDFQCIQGKHPYESSKRLCEILSIALNNQLKDKKISCFTTSPGNVLSEITGNVVNTFAIWIALLRLFGCSGINITGYNAATSAIYVVQGQDLDPEQVYHSEINIFGRKWTRPLKMAISKETRKDGEILLEKLDIMRRELFNNQPFHG